jgi:cell division protein FtsX
MLIGALYFFPSLYLYQFASKVKQAILLTDKIQMAASLEKLKSFFKFWGIFMIVILGFYALMLVGVMIGVGIGASHH